MDKDNTENENISFPKPNLATTIIPNKMLIRAVSQNNIGSSKV